MLFTTGAFTFVFLPVVAIGFFLLGRAPRAAASWLGIASLFFYGYWIPAYLALLISSVLVNFAIGVTIGRWRDAPGGTGMRRARLALMAGLVFNLGLLAYFKYANFMLDTARVLTGADLPFANVALPIGISFFTFTQIAFLVDTCQKGTREYRFIHYLLFVTYFPHLVAGPVLHHVQMMPQFSDPAIYRSEPSKIAAGTFLFAVGLAKKVVIADGIAPYANAVFEGVHGGTAVTTVEAWIGTLAYTFQLYFDFSGYSDMAVGLSMILGVRLPYNFDSPYRASNISDFWRRWHMTLSAFLRDYLYIPLGGNRRGSARRYANLMTTMLLGGLWHGAQWTFVAWGGLHGLYLAAHHAVGARFSAFASRVVPTRAVSVLGWLVTMLAVVVAWVFFRAVDFASAGKIVAAMFSWPAETGLPRLLWNAGLQPVRGGVLLAACLAVALVPANSNRLFDGHLRLCSRSLAATWISIGAGLSVVVLLIVVSELRATSSPFIYFNF